MKRVAFKTLGCRLNQAETAHMAGAFTAAGYAVVPFDEPCDVAVVHTCAVTAQAHRKCVGYARRARAANPDALVVMAGCDVEADREKLLSATGADLAVGQDQKFNLPSLLPPPPTHHPPSTTHHPPSTPGGKAAPPLFTTTRALVKVQDGCDFRCSYCIVPHTRGTPVSRPAVEVIDEVKRLAADGYREVVLTGANLGCYADGPRRLPELVREVEAVDGIARIRLSSIESTTTEREIIALMAASTKLCRTLHLPLQSGDDDTLRRMGRRYTVAQYRAVVDYALSLMPTVGLGTDLIVGTPGETPAAHANTMALVRDLPFSNLHVFTYSPRPHTRTAGEPDQLPGDVKSRRRAELVELGRAKRHTFALGFVGQPVQVLIEKAQDGIGTGWTGEYIQTRVHTTPAPNDILTVVPSGVDKDVLLA